MENPKRCNEEGNVLRPNTQARHRHRRDHRMVMGNITKRQPRVDAARIGSKKVEFQLDFDISLRGTTITRRYRHHEQHHHRHDPTKRVKNSYGNQ